MPSPNFAGFGSKSSGRCGRKTEWCGSMESHPPLHSLCRTRVDIKIFHESPLRENIATDESRKSHARKIVGECIKLYFICEALFTLQWQENFLGNATYPKCGYLLPMMESSSRIVTAQFRQ